MRDRLESLRKPLPYFLAALILAGAARTWELSMRAERHQQRIVGKVESRLQSLEEEAMSFLADADLLDCLGREGLRCDRQEEARALTEYASVLVYRADSLAWWSDNSAVPRGGSAHFETGTHFVSLRNGYHVLVAGQPAEGPWRAVVLIPVRRDYEIQNRYLQPDFADFLRVPASYTLGGLSDSAKLVVHSDSGKELFRLGMSQGADPSAEHTGTRTLFAMALLSWFLLLYVLSAQLARRGYAFWGLLVLVATLFSTSLLLRAFQFPESLRSLDIFQPEYYASPGIAASLGDFLTDALMWGLVLLYFHRHADPLSWMKRLRLHPVVSAAALGLVFFGLLRLVVTVCRSLVLDSSIPMRLDEFFRLDAFSLMGLFALAAVLGIFFVLGRELVSTAFGLAVRPKDQIAGLLFGLGLYMGTGFLLGHQSIRLLPVLWGIGFIVLHHLFRRSETGFGFSIVTTWLAYLAVIAAGVLLHTNRMNDEQSVRQFAENKALDRDPEMEFLFSRDARDIARRISEDPFVVRYFDNPFRGPGSADDQIRETHLGNYFNDYRTTTSYYNHNRRLLAGEASPSQEVLDSLVAAAQLISQESLHLVEFGDDVFYLARIEVNYGEDHAGQLYLRFDRRLRSDNSIYPELLLETVGTKVDNPGYDHAIYEEGQLQERSGEYPYPFRFSGFQPEPGSFDSRRLDGTRQTVYAASQDKLIVVTREREGWLKPISLFSYLFLFFLMLGLVVAAVYIVLRLFLRRESLSDLIQISLRGRIQSLVVILIIGSFLVIGAVTLLYFRGRYDDYHRSRLLRKVRAVEAEIAYQAEEDAGSSRRKDVMWPFLPDFEVDLPAVSEIHAMDVNLFNLQGNLVSSSQPEIFNQGLISRKMSPSAWHRLHRLGESLHVQEERIGRLDYLGAYVPLRSRAGAGVGYLHLPYFAKEKNLREEVSTFMTALINVYVLLLVAAGLLALVLSNSITRSLALISARFREVQLVGSNEPIAWNSQDEIGILVSEYNKMLAELERSANLLARSERESAWREMAKQVAHEIKNPLTPMRLSIQHLQRAWANDDPRADELARRVTRTLLEQIDNLSRIATEFSDFAKMPRAVRENVRLEEVVDAAVDLFREDQAVDISWDGVQEPVWVYADKHQMIRVFNNLIKNAIQAIPDEREGKITVDLGLTDELVDVRVRDNGSGIPEDRRRDVFIPNFTTKNSGMGLGLSMCKNIVESGGGRIWFESVEDEGTTFHVELPRISEDGFRIG